MTAALHVMKLRPDQSAIVRHPAKIKVLSMGRRYGKTEMGRTVSMCTANDGGRVAWIVPTFKNGAPLWRGAEASVADLRRDKRVRTNKSERIVEFDNGGFLGLYSDDNIDAIRGEAFHLAVLDEAARIREDSWHAAIEPTLADYDGDAILISTPRGRNWFYRMYAAATGNRQAAWKAPSYHNPMPTIRSAYRRAKGKLASRIFRQEWDADFIEGGGLVFRNLAAATRPCWTANILAAHNYVVGVDWGRAEDWTVITVIDANTRELVYYDRFNQIDYQLQLRRLKAIYQRYQPVVMIGESNSMGEPLITQLQYEGYRVLPFYTTNASKGLIIEDLELALENHGLWIPPDEALRTELESFEMTRLPSGLTRYAAPEGMHDDIVMSLAFAYHGLQRGRATAVGGELGVF